MSSLLIALSNVLMFYAADQLSFHFHFLRIIVLPFQKMNKVVCVFLGLLSRGYCPGVICPDTVYATRCCSRTLSRIECVLRAWLVSTSVSTARKSCLTGAHIHQPKSSSLYRVNCLFSELSRRVHNRATEINQKSYYFIKRTRIRPAANLNTSRPMHTRSSAVAERTRDATRRWKFCQLTQGHPGSLEITPLSKFLLVFHYNYIPIFFISDIKRDLGRKSRFVIHSTPPLGGPVGILPERLMWKTLD